MSRICPLFFASAVSEIEVECRPDRCAWAYGGGCAITTIAESLDVLNDDGLVVWTEKEATP